jgi:hypothetical protein
MARAHSAMMPPQLHIRVDATPARRAPSAPEPLSPNLMRISSLPTSHAANTPTMAGAGLFSECWIPGEDELRAVHCYTAGQFSACCYFNTCSVCH